jgi:hypothetical protein
MSLLAAIALRISVGPVQWLVPCQAALFLCGALSGQASIIRPIGLPVVVSSLKICQQGDD